MVVDKATIDDKAEVINIGRVVRIAPRRAQPPPASAGILELECSLFIAVWRTNACSGCIIRKKSVSFIYAKQKHLIPGIIPSGSILLGIGIRRDHGSEDHILLLGYECGFIEFTI